MRVTKVNSRPEVLSALPTFAASYRRWLMTLPPGMVGTSDENFLRKLNGHVAERKLDISALIASGAVEVSS